MKVKKLIKKLMKLDPDSKLVLAKDAEGNSFSPLSDITEELYVETSPWRGYIITETSNNSKDADPAVVIWPTN